jgi:superfamily II DNA/RNA helicase
VKVALVVGGEPMQPQVRALQEGAQIVVGTPGRVLDLYGQKFLSFPWTEFACSTKPTRCSRSASSTTYARSSRHAEERQTLLFSATFPAALLKLARDAHANPAEVATAPASRPSRRIEQSSCVSTRGQPLALMRLIEQSAPDDVFLVFCDRRTDVDRLMRRSSAMPFSVKALHGGYDQASRFRVMSAFRTGEVKACRDRRRVARPRRASTSRTSSTSACRRTSRLHAPHRPHRPRGADHPARRGRPRPGARPW